MNGLELFATTPTTVEVCAIASMVGLLCASCVVWSMFFSRRSQQTKVESAPPSEPPPVSFPALALVIFLVVSSLLSQRSQVIQVENLQSRCLESLVVWALLLGSLLIVPGVSLRAYGFQFQGLLKQLGLGVLAFLASFLPVYLLLLATSPLRSAEALHPFLLFLKSNPGPAAVVWIGLSVSIAAPLLEELMYRVVLQTTLSRWLPAGVAIPLTAMLFCLVHGWPDMIPLLPLALVLGFVYHRYQSYLAVVACHSLFNSWMLAWALLVPSTG